MRSARSLSVPQFTQSVGHQLRGNLSLSLPNRRRLFSGQFSLSITGLHPVLNKLLFVVFARSQKEALKLSGSDEQQCTLCELSKWKSGGK